MITRTYRDFFFPLMFVGLISSLTFSLGCLKEDFDNTRIYEWKAEASSIEKLGPETEVLGIKIRPPQGFTMNGPEDGPVGSKIASWFGERRNDGSFPTIQLMIVEIPDGEKVPACDEALRQMIGAVQQGCNSIKQEIVDVGKVNGTKFSRTSWTGSDFGKFVKGHFYISTENGMIYQLATRDLTEFKDTDLEVCHASILSFKK